MELVLSLSSATLFGGEVAKALPESKKSLMQDTKCVGASLEIQGTRSLLCNHRPEFKNEMKFHNSTFEIQQLILITSQFVRSFFMGLLQPEILDLEEGSGETGEISNRCLVGKILAQKTLNLQGVTNILKSSWKTRANFTIALWSSSVFLFRFEDEEDCNEVLKDGPWSVMNNLLVLKPLGKGEVIQSMDFSSCPFWVQIHGLPVDKMSRANAEIIGKCFDKLLAIEGGPEGLLLHRSFLRIKVNINLSLPFPKGFWLKKKSPGNSDIWISYKFEKLSDYCYACGRVGHEKKGCRFISREAGETSCYGPDLRAPKARPCPVPVEEFKKQVD
ncbi:hypothetical protein RHGRI_002246 [Rhododendron griersonianum]|uniref:CCHC-type domain-containing protein n=1 Tax=Rhododendron griersonianum TaxID=479676 RepID=A0AAV6LN56_9ERIC|nr:hypothetical protein RHGRI_002246 [Rhododendron griersonianum]